MKAPTEPLRIGLLTFQIVGVVCAIFFAGCAIGAIRAHQYGPVWGFGFFVALGAWLVVGAGVFELTDDAIEHRTAFGRCRMPWRDIRRIECGIGGTLVLHGDDKRFVVSPPAMWSGRQKPEAFGMFRRKLEELGVVFYSSNVADYKINRNVRVRE